MTRNSNRDIVQSIGKGIDVIRSFSPGKPILSVSEVAERTGLTRAAARRFMITWSALGYLSPIGNKYSLAPKLLELGYSYLSSIPWREMAMVQLQSIASRTGESCSVEILDYDHVIHVARAPGQDVLAPNIPVGTKFPAFATASGRVLLAFLPEPAIEEFFRRFVPEKFTSDTVTDPLELKEILLKVKDQGYCVVRGELKENLWVHAVPIFDERGRAIAAINVGGYGMKDMAKIMEFHSLLIEASTALRRAW